MKLALLNLRKLQPFENYNKLKLWKRNIDLRWLNIYCAKFTEEYVKYDIREWKVDEQYYLIQRSKHSTVTSSTFFYPDLKWI